MSLALLRNAIGIGAVCLIAATPVHADPNLVANGNFEAGNTSFSSDYVFSPATNSTEGQYTVRLNPYPWNGLFISGVDHTSGSGLMYVGNGSPADGAVVWESTAIAVTPGTDYFFEAFVMNVCCSGPFPGNTPSILEFSVEGLAVESLGTVTTDLALAGTWEGLSRSWNSGANTSVVLSLINRNTARAGNDFAIDDIHLGTTSTVTPVPEPETYALMLAGLAALGTVARRRRRR
ncbi:MAG: PEP-CTERM sorting domain-containing protein [Caldimonas sp.]